MSAEFRPFPKFPDPFPAHESRRNSRQDVIEEGTKSARNNGCCISESIYPRSPGEPPVSGDTFVLLDVFARSPQDIGILGCAQHGIGLEVLISILPRYRDTLRLSKTKSCSSIPLIYHLASFIFFSQLNGVLRIMLIFRAYKGGRVILYSGKIYFPEEKIITSVVSLYTRERQSKSSL